MAHGTPDWGVTAGAVTTYQLTDLAELAARLGSLDTFDRRGDFIWGDGFEAGLGKWSSTVDGAGAAIALSTASARNGRYSCLLTAGSDGTRLARITHYNPFPVLSNFGFEFSFNSVTGFDTIDWRLWLFDGSQAVRFQVRYDNINLRLQYLDAAGAFVDLLTGFVLSGTSRIFHNVKLVVDGINRNYVRILFNNRSFDLTGVAGQVTANNTFAAVDLSIILTSEVGVNDQIYIDDVILTQNEPA